MDMRSRKIILKTSSVISTSEQKYWYAQMRLVEEACEWLEESHIDYRCWLVLQNLFYTRYAPYLSYASEADYNEPNVEEPEPKDVEDSEPEPEVKEPEPEVTELEVEELSIETLVDLSTEPTHEVIVFVATYDFSLVFEISWRLQPIVDLPIGGRITRDQASHGAKCGQFVIHMDG